MFAKLEALTSVITAAWKYGQLAVRALQAGVNALSGKVTAEECQAEIDVIHADAKADKDADWDVVG